LGVSFGIESSILDPEDTKKVFPLIDADVIQGSLYSPGDGVVDSCKLSMALTQSAVKGGGQASSCYWPHNLNSLILQKSVTIVDSLCKCYIGDYLLFDLYLISIAPLSSRN
jgi:hypothetical protein